MGEVYRARDTRLGREVALKILPAEVAGDSSRRQRFELEARAVAALNHPNIVAIYDVGDGYIVTELVDGEPLCGTKFGLRKIMDVAKQVAAGLSCAHDAGIVHRDLKPANILLTRDGRVKILDFGLAKVTRTAGEANAETLTVHTDPGVVMGTVGYMSLEQVRSVAADHRSDIFSFGLILYELLAGKRAFRGDTAAETMTAILKQDPPELPETVPMGVRQTVMHCLEKEPLSRFQSARDLTFALESIATTSGSETRPTIKQPSYYWLRPVATAVLILAVAVGSWLLARRTNRTTPPQFHQVTFPRGYISGARFVGDGHTIIYSAAWDGKPAELFTTLESSPESRPLGITTLTWQRSRGLERWLCFSARAHSSG
jgi:serine/threonine protein kinase